MPGGQIQKINDTFRQCRIPVEIKTKRNSKDIQKPKMNGPTARSIVRIGPTLVKLVASSKARKALQDFESKKTKASTCAASRQLSARTGRQQPDCSDELERLKKAANEEEYWETVHLRVWEEWLWISNALCVVDPQELTEEQVSLYSPPIPPASSFKLQTSCPLLLPAPSLCPSIPDSESLSPSLLHSRLPSLP
jgi:hypothetical protein